MVGFERRVMIVFRVEPTRVIVARVFYGGQDWERILKGAEESEAGS